jgi:hypothetical protein
VPNITEIDPDDSSDIRTMHNPIGNQLFSKTNRENSPSILTLETPSLEEIAMIIWQRQHDQLNREAISHETTWRDRSLPSKFWDEFLLDAQAVLSLLYKKHIEYENTH